MNEKKTASETPDENNSTNKDQPPEPQPEVTQEMESVQQKVEHEQPTEGMATTVTSPAEVEEEETTQDTVTKTSVDDNEQEEAQFEARETEEVSESKSSETLNLEILQHSLSEGFQGLRDEFNTKLRYDYKKDGIIDKLHAELMEYRNDLIKKLLRPLIMDAIMMADDVRKLVETYRAKNPDQLDPQKLLELGASFADDLDHMLYRQGVDTFETEGNHFDPKRQKVLKREITDQEELDKTIKNRVRKGYDWDKKVIRPELVDVYVCK